MQLKVFSDHKQVLHDQGKGHPERPQRLKAVRGLLGDSFPDVPVETASEATRDHLLRVHHADYVDEMLELRGRSKVLDPDTRVGPPTIEAALLAAGCGIAAVDEVVTGVCERAFAAVRPPGHHAEADRAMGFCYFNNIAVAAAHAVAEHGLERVLVVDWDVHHGNGTQHIFEHRGDVSVFNLHQFPFYPGSGKLSERGTGEGVGRTINCPLGAGHGDRDYYAVFDHVLEPFCRSWRPELVLVSAGYDAHRADPLGAMKVTDDGFGGLARRVRTIAEEHCDGRIVAMMEGGYDIAGLVGGVRETLRAWTGDPRPYAPVEGPFERDVEEVIAFHQFGT